LSMRATLRPVEGADTIPHRAYGYSPRGGGVVQTDQSVTSATLGDGGIYTNVDDMARWDLALYGAELVDSATLDLATTPPQLPAGAETQYGFGWFVDSYRGEKRWRHTGETSGFRNAIQRFPRRRLTIIVLTNRSSGEPAALEQRDEQRVLLRTQLRHLARAPHLMAGKVDRHVAEAAEHGVRRAGHAFASDPVEKIGRSLHRRDDALIIERLQEIVERLDLECAHGVLVEGGDEDDRRGALVTRGRGHRETVEVGHLDVQEDQVGRPTA